MCVAKMRHVCQPDKVLDTALRAVGDKHKLAREASVSVRTAERWLSGEVKPNASLLLRLMTKCRAVADAVYLATSEEFLKAEEVRLQAEISVLRARRGQKLNDGALSTVLSSAATTSDTVVVTHEDKGVTP